MDATTLTLAGSLIASLGGFYYLYCTVKGTVKPNRVTWFFWGFFPMIAFAAQVSQGVGVIAWVTFIAGLTPFLIVIASFFNPLAYWKIEKLDYVFVAIALTGLALWQITDNANLALTFSLLADLAAAMPTILKSFKYPGTESWTAYGISAVGFAISILALEEWRYESAAFVLYLFSINFVLAVLALRK